jgi:hypothetical protein
MSVLACVIKGDNKSRLSADLWSVAGIASEFPLKGIKSFRQ